MKSVILIGKMNSLLKDIHHFLSQQDELRVQLCGDSPVSVSGMMKIAEPDAALISLVGLDESHEALFINLRTNYPSLPVITLGTKEECDRFIRYYYGGQFINIIRPIENEKLLEALENRLDINAEHEKTVSANAAEAAKKQILVVDDSGPVLRTIKSMLEDIYDVKIVNSGMNAMKSIGKSRPDLILLDYEMPVCDGRQTLEMIRADDEIADIPVVFLTGVNDREHIEPILKLRPAGYMLKPPVKDTLRSKIAEVLGETIR